MGKTDFPNLISIILLVGIYLGILGLTQNIIKNFFENSWGIQLLSYLPFIFLILYYRLDDKFRYLHKKYPSRKFFDFLFSFFLCILLLSGWKGIEFLDSLIPTIEGSISSRTSWTTGYVFYIFLISASISRYILLRLGKILLLETEETARDMLRFYFFVKGVFPIFLIIILFLDGIFILPALSYRDGQIIIPIIFAISGIVIFYSYFIVLGMKNSILRYIYFEQYFDKVRIPRALKKKAMSKQQLKTVVRYSQNLDVLLDVLIKEKRLKKRGNKYYLLKDNLYNIWIN